MFRDDSNWFRFHVDFFKQPLSLTR